MHSSPSAQPLCKASVAKWCCAGSRLAEQACGTCEQTWKQMMQQAHSMHRVGSAHPVHFMNDGMLKGLMSRQPHASQQAGRSHSQREC
jgi:hypothetical protein